MNDTRTSISNCAKAVPESSIAKRARELMECVAKMQGWTYVPPDQRGPRLTPLERDLARPEEHPEHTVYFLYGAGRVKIGFTTGDPLKREDALSAQCPVPLSLLKVTPGGKITEFRLHHQFRGERLYGEWFRLSDDLRAHILEDNSRAPMLAEADRAYIRWLRSELKTMEERYGSSSD